MRQNAWNHKGHGAVVLLIERDVFQPLGVKGGGVVIERGRARKDLSIAGPAETFIALRAVCRHIEKISFLAPDDVVLQLVEKRIRSLEQARPGDGRMHDNARKVLRVYFARPAAHRDITKPLKSEMWLEPFRSHAFGGVANGFFSRAQIGGIEISGFVEHFRVTQGDGSSGRSGHPE